MMISFSALQYRLEKHTCQSTMNRIWYKFGNPSINGVVVNAEIKELSSSFVLTQCFCSCPLPLGSMINEYNRSWCSCGRLHQEIEVHYDDCPNANKDRFLRLVTQKEIEEYKALG